LPEPLVRLVEGLKGDVTVEEPVAPHLEAAAASKLRIVESVLFKTESTFAEAAEKSGPRRRLERGGVLAGKAVNQPENLTLFAKVDLTLTSFLFPVGSR